MNNTEQLIIRACKSLDPYQRLGTTYDRFYINRSRMSESAYINSMMIILASIVDKYLDVSITEIIERLDPKRFWRPGAEIQRPSYRDRAFEALISIIRLAKADEFEGLTTPAKFRNRVTTDQTI